jgi:hypothetical protein
MHPLICEAMVAARRRDIEAALVHRSWVGDVPRSRRRARRPARVILGMRLIGLGLRLVDIGPPPGPPSGRTFSPNAC